MAFKFDILFEISVPRPWDDNKEMRRFHEMLDQVVFAEEMGFHTVWSVEHHFLREVAHSSGNDMLLAALSQRTSRIRLGLGVQLMLGRVNHPIRVAERAAILDLLSNGRLEMGTGRSSSPYQLKAFGVDTRTTREEWEEATKLLPELWSQDNFSYHGEFFDWDDKITVVPRPVQKPHPPLWLAASQPATCALAGEKGLGLLMPSLTTPERLTESVQAYKQAVAAPLDQIGAYAHDQCVLTTVAFCNDDDEKARIVGGEAGAWYLKNLSEIYQNDWAGEPIDSIPDSYRYHAQIREDSRRLDHQVVGGGNWGSDVQLDVGRDDAYVELIDSGAFCIGDPAKVIANVLRYRATGADRLACISQLGDIRHEDIMRSIELFGREIMPAVRAAEEAEEAETVAAGAPAGA